MPTKKKPIVQPQEKEKKISKSKSDYGAKDILILKGLEPVRKRPAMYIGTTGPDGLHHLVYEIINNSIDEAIAGFCDEIKVEFLSNNQIRVSDNGRGIPIEVHPETKKSTLETIITTLHSGGKFGGKAYQVSGGLHGVGLSVVCALSNYMRVEVCRDGGKFAQEYSRGKVKTKVNKIGSSKKTGTMIIFDPDSEIFPDIHFDSKKILEYLRQQAYLTKSVKIIVSDKREKLPVGSIRNYTFYFEGGIASYVKYLTKGRKLRHDNIFYSFAPKNGILVETAFCYITNEYEFLEESFANNIFTREGGTHLTGFRTALTRSLNDYARKNGFLKENDTNLSGQDVHEGLTAVISIKVKDPQFEGQTKEKLGNPEARLAVDSIVSEKLIDFLERNPSDAKAIIENCVLSQKARDAAKAARETVLRKGILEGLSLPGKLADCSSKDPSKSEIFIVEGDSAGGSGKQARDRRFQAILPLRGKILNIERARLDKVLASKEIKALVIAMGTSIGEDFNIEKARYHRIIIMTDSDVDGQHITTLLLTFFYRYFKPIINAGYLYIAQSPLYKIQLGKKLEYAYSEEEKAKVLKSIEKDSKTGSKINMQRYKGLGEMNPEQLWDTTMNPATRTLLRVDIESDHQADRVFDVLMGKEVAPRKRFIQTHAKKVKNLDI
ncbi:MAG: DNA topoisomerase (ATP-hydrolyzing) subunit B [Patescibacteria group bacterium]|nr:DNA topoisomerase (ATP-hydrolyzing) subunit B [Patescibacteria group bacterium]MBU1876872.1 DNA topoisomerase (ATP-hydrolyzing) subunit B [Patescibacteria group bacterium]